MNNKVWYWTGAILFIAAVVIIIFSVRSCKTSVKTEKTEVTATLDPCPEQFKEALAKINTLESENQRLQAELKECCPKPKKLSLEERVELLEKQRRSAPPTQPGSKKRLQIDGDIPERDFSEGGFKSSSDFQRQVNTGTQVNTGVKMDFEGSIPNGSKYGTTITPDRFLLYYLWDNYLRSNGMSIPAPRLNGENGPEFTYDAASGYWFYIDRSTIITPAMLNNPNYTRIWCAGIGPIGTWYAFLPHESLKAEMKRVRGREDGSINMQELYQMHQANPDIWTDKNKQGTLMPKSFNPISGEVDKGTKIGPEDGLVYQGWDFRTMIVGTVTTDKVNGNSSYSNTSGGQISPESNPGP